MKEINIAKMIAKKRKEKKITQDELAKYLGVSKAAISKWETGQSYPDITFLPILASYFNVSIDELIGYEPQMMKEEIKSLYQRLCHDFTTRPFNDVIEECQDIIRKYYSCFHLLFQMGVLIINHSMLDSNQTKKLNEQAKSLFERVKLNSEDVDLAKQAQMVEAYCCLLLNEPQEALVLLEGSQKPQLSGEVLQATAYQMLGQLDEAKAALQISLFKSLISIVEAFPMLLSLGGADQFEETVSRFMKVEEAFELRKLNPYVVMPILLVVAQGYVQHGKVEQALDYLDDYSKLCTYDFYPLKFRGTPFFDVIEDWYETFDLGNIVPRDEVLIKKSMKDALLQNPVFTVLHENERFTHLVNRLGE